MQEKQNQDSNIFVLGILKANRLDRKINSETHEMLLDHSGSPRPYW